MKQKLPWIVAAVLGVAFLGCLLGLAQARTARTYAANEAKLAQQAKIEADAAVEKALAARQAAEAENQTLLAAKKQTDAQLASAQTALSVAKQQVDDQKNALPLAEAETAAARKALAEIQRSTSGTGATKSESRKIPVATAVPLRAPGGWSVPDMLPPNTLGLITLRDVPTSVVKAKETGLYKILTHPDFERVFRKQLGQIRGGIFAGEVMLGVRSSDLLSYVSQGEITFAVLGADKRLPDGQPLLDLVLSIELRDRAPAFMDEFNKRLDQLKAAAAGRLEYTQSPLGNTTVTRFKLQDFPGQLSCGLCDGTFLMCLGDGRLEKLIAMREKMKSAAALKGTATPDVLAQVPAFKLALEKAGPNADALVYANVDEILKNPIINDPNKEMTPTQKHELEVSGLRDVSAASYSFGIKDGGVRESIFLDVPAARRKGVLGLMSSEAADASAFAAAPRSSVIASTFKINLEQLLEKGVALAAIEDPQAREKVAAGLLFIGQTYNLDPQKDILGALTGQGTFSLSVPYKNSKVAVAFPQPILALRIKDQDGVKRLFSALQKAATEQLEFIDTSEGNKTITLARKRERPADGIHQFCYVIDGDDLLLSIYPLALREEIRRRASKNGRLDEDPEFNFARSNLPGQSQAMVYVDAAALAVAIYDVLVPVVQIQGKEQQIDVNALPTADVLSQNLGSAMVNLNFAADGIVLQSYSPSGVFAVLVPAAIGAKAQRDRQAAQNNPDAAAQPAAAPAPKPRADDAKKIETMTKLTRDLKEYAAEHGGKFPKNLAEMRPRFLQDIGKEIDYIVWIGTQTADNKIVAHSSDKLSGNIIVLTQNGGVHPILRATLGKVLREGYIEGNAAVKPPKPPEF
ncbi:MAG: hypothetical protein WCT04_17915 [Planctomycetota bacterium]